MIAEFHYAVGWRATGVHPGGHAGAHAGGGFEFTGHVPFLAHPDPRHLDIRASLRDPFRQLVSRSFRQRSAIPVFVLADLSASLGFGAKREMLADFAAACAYSAYRAGDRFGFLGGDEVLRWDAFLPCRQQGDAARELRERLTNWQPAGRSALGLQDAAPHLGRQRSLVFLVSDFHLPLAEIEQLLGTLVRHDVVPVVLWDSAEFERLPARGLAYVEDPETGERRRLWMRPSLREKFREAFAQRREALTRLCAQRGREPFFIIDRFDPDGLTRYFLSGLV